MKAPRILNDLYADLRDRRLLPLVAVLVVAIPALPLLLSSGAEDSVVSSGVVESAVSADESAAVPAVLASDPGLRDYRERLDAMRSKDPFAGNSDNPEAAANAISEVETEGGGGATPALPVGGSAAHGISEFDAASGSAVPTSSAGGSSESATSTTSATSSGGGGSTGGSTTGSQSRWFTYRIDVATGRAGDVDERRNVKRLTVLPSQSNPVALFLGASEGGKRATFLVSTDVVRTHGDGSCLPSPSDCQILELEPGQERKFAYAPRGEPDTYVIKLQDIRVVEIDEPKGAPSSKQAQSANAGLESFLGL